MIKLPTCQRQYGGYYAAYYVGGEFSNNGKVWFSCREDFHRYLNRRKKKDMFFRTGDRKTQFRRILNDLQDALKIPDDERCKVLSTDDDDIVFIQTGTWWAKQDMRMSFLTAVMKLAKQSTSLKSILNNGFYFRYTKEAVKAFMSGRTWYVGEGTMWVWTFNSGGNTKFLKEPPK